MPKEQQREMIHGYRACVSYTDAQIGKVLAKLDELGLIENTIVVLWGDLGWHLGDHGIWCKHSTYEQATRSPLIISAPVFSVRGKTDASVESVDIFPTLCDLAGLPIPEQLEGTSLVPLLTNLAAKVKTFSMSQYPDHAKKGLMGYAMRTARYRLVTWVDDWVSRTGTFDESKIDPLETLNQANNPEYEGLLKDLQTQLKPYFSDSVNGAGK